MKLIEIVNLGTSEIDEIDSDKLKQFGPKTYIS